MERARTPVQVHLVRSSFARIRPIRDQAAALFYRRLFELDPDLRPLFRGNLAARGPSSLPRSAPRSARSTGWRTSCRWSASSAAGHAAYGVQPHHYATVGEALVWTLAQALGHEFTRETRRAWTDAYARLAWAMIAAAEEPDEHAQAA